MMALLVLLAVFVVDSVDRRDEVLRWERLGATPTQTRGAAALHAAILTGSITVFNVSIAALLVKLGTDAFSRELPEIAIPFVTPWTTVLFLLLGMPLLAAAVAALVARPVTLS